jgi:peroxiredoxin family protein
LIATAQELGVRLIPCQMTMDVLGVKPGDLLDGLEEPIGAATAMAEMRDAAVSLFI